MKLSKLAGATSEIWQVFIKDSSSTTGAGLTGLTNASSSLTAYYHRDTDTTATVINLVTMTVGTFTSSGFKEIDATNMPGWYQFCPPNAANASGAKSCAFHLKGATNMAPLPIEVQLVAYNPDDAGMTTNSGTAQAGTVNSITLASGASATNNLYNGQTVKISSGTGSGQARVITNYNGTSKIATVDRPFQTAPDNTSVYIVMATDTAALNGSLQPSVAVPSVAIRTGTAQAGSTSTTIKLDASASATNNLYQNDLVTITGGTGLGQTRTVVSYAGSTKIATVDRAWTTTPDNTSTFAIYASTTPSLYSDQGVAQAGAATSITLASTASATNSIYVGSIVTILAGTGVGGTGEITAYNGTTKVATVSSAWSVNPDSTSVYAVIPTASGTGSPATIQDVNVLTWGSVAVQPLPSNFTSFSIDSNGRAKIQSGITKNTAFSGFVFQMTDSTTHAPKTGLTVTSQRSIDGAALATSTNAVTELSNGDYIVNLSAADLNCTNTVMFRFTAAAADDLNILLVPVA